MSAEQFLSHVDLRGHVARLRLPRVEEAERVFAMLAGRREILDWIEWSGPENSEELREKARNWRVETGGAANYQLALAHADTDESAGSLSLLFIDHPERADVGYWVGAAHQGRGLASDAIGLAVWLAFNVLDARSVSACVFVGNVASRRVLEKHGFGLRPSAAGEITCSARERWTFGLERSVYEVRANAPRPVEFDCAFRGALP